MKAEINEFKALIIIPENRVEGMGIEKWFDEHVRINQAEIIFCVQPFDEDGKVRLCNTRLGKCKCR